MTHILSVLVMNKPGVLTRVAGLFSRRNFNIDSLNVGQTEDPDRSRMTIVVRGDRRTLEQVTKQLNKLIDVIKVSELSGGIVDRDLALIRVNCPQARRGEIIQVIDTFRGKIVDMASESLVVEVTGTEDKIEALIEVLRGFGIMEVVRTGLIAMARGQLLQNKAEKIS